jgi:hypothetical protein
MRWWILDAGRRRSAYPTGQAVVVCLVKSLEVLEEEFKSRIGRELEKVFGKFVESKELHVKVS